MGAISALSDTGSTLQRNPVLFAGALVIGLVGTFANFGTNFIPLVGLLLAFLYFFVEPLLAGGFLGMADEAVGGRTSFGSFWEHGKQNYTDLLVARLVLGVVIFVSFVVFVIAMAFVLPVGTAGVGGVQSDPSAAMSALGGALLLMAILYLVFGLVAVLVGLAIQFYPAAIVIGDAGPMESFKYSFQLFKAYPLSVVGYSLVAGVVGLLVAIAAFAMVVLALGGIGAITSMAAPTSDAAAGGSLVAGLLLVGVAVVGLRTIQIGILRTYYVAFVRSVAAS